MMELDANAISKHVLANLEAKQGWKFSGEFRADLRTALTAVVNEMSEGAVAVLDASRIRHLLEMLDKGETATLAPDTHWHEWLKRLAVQMNPPNTTP